MLHVARIRRKVPAVLADALALPLATEAADALLLAYLLFHLAKPARAVAEAARVLRRGGACGHHHLGVGTGIACRCGVGSGSPRCWRAAGPAPPRGYRAGHARCRGSLAGLGRASATAHLAAPAPSSTGPLLVLGTSHWLGRQPGPAQPHRRRHPRQRARAREAAWTGWGRADFQWEGEVIGALAVKASTAVMAPIERESEGAGSTSVPESGGRLPARARPGSGGLGWVAAGRTDPQPGPQRNAEQNQ